MPKIAVTSISFSGNRTLTERLGSFFDSVKLNLQGIRLKGEALSEFIDGAEAVIVGTERVDALLLDHCPELKIVSKYGVGLDNLDLKELEKRGIKVGWTPGVNRLSVAEMALGFMISLSRNLYLTSMRLKNGEWFKNGGMQLTGKTVGIIGVGNVGKEVIRLLTPFNCRILVNDIIDQQEYYRENGLTEATKEEIFRQADIVTVHTPLTEMTRGMINSGVFSAMKNSAFLLNTSRGPVVVQEHLKQALLEKQIAAAAVDVYELEPCTDIDYLSLDNLFCTPHIGGNAMEAILSMGGSAIDHLLDFYGLKRGNDEG